MFGWLFGGSRRKAEKAASLIAADTLVEFNLTTANIATNDCTANDSTANYSTTVDSASSALLRRSPLGTFLTRRPYSTFWSTLMCGNSA